MRDPFVPTDARGVELLKIIKARLTPVGNGVPAWAQNTWGSITLPTISEDTQFEVALNGRVKVPAETAWECGTSFCVAGHAVLAAGLPLWATPSSGNSWLVFWAGDHNDVGNVAQDLLELDLESRRRLFYEGNTFEQVHAMLDVLINGGTLAACEYCGCEDRWAETCDCQVYEDEDEQP